ncbi:hypothetical protein KY495_17415 [Massilia sp. PAMC28688]|uniref:hypothetical protein n=1 Tax=Massilia sp. PAMC28688 TaxID=2861283 RepID=UPI001C633FC8|nr:hypothetical protein [Massilia sp. PAMC28688]QYF92508.1 hypothetical protein KY495_17415 [Massilia sp. PAMC28688]
MDTIRFIVRARADDDTLAQFLAGITAEPAFEVVDTIGPAGRPHTAVIAVCADQAPVFEQRFRHSPHIAIERDRPLSLLDKTAHFLHRSERKSHAEKS